MKFPEKKVIIFDLDDTLSEAKTPMLPSMAEAIEGLLRHAHVAVITGSKWDQCRGQMVEQMPASSQTLLHKLHILPNCGTRLYQYKDGEWISVYAELLSEEEKKQIKQALEISMKGMYDASTLYGDIIEDRESSMAFSALGQQAPIEIKKSFDPDKKIRLKMLEKLIPMLPDHEVKIGGTTTIDITKKGMDKGWGIQRFANHLGVSLDEIGFLGDAIFPGGNDYPAKEIGLHCIQVANPHETEVHIRSWSKRAER
jgi:HAD superfamily hydrolase (TIGR01484 family)